MTNLTDKWKKGELPSGWYWVKYRNGRIDMWDLLGGITIETKPEIVEVLDEVPSYDEYQETQKWIKHLEEKIKIYERKDKQATETSIAYNELLEENAQLKKWCEEFNALDVAKENTKLKELLKECRDKWVCYKPYDRDQLLKRIDKILANNQIQANTVACNKIQENE